MMRILAVTTMRNEGPFILEWIAHLRTLGVTDILVYSNDCDDGTDALLDQLAVEKILIHIPQTLKKNQSPQWTALKAAWDHPLRKECDWALVCDIDEFFQISVGDGGFADLIGSCPNETDAIAMPWRLFGNSGVVKFKDIPVTAQFTQAIDPTQIYPVGATFFKSLFRLAGPFNQFGVHRPRQKNPERHGVPNWIGGGGHPLPDLIASNADRMSLIGDSQGRDLVQCNHYSLRSAESFIVKHQRGLPNRRQKLIDQGYWINRNFNHMQDRRLEQRLPALTAAIDELKSRPQISALHESCVVNHRRLIDTALADQTIFQLYSDILLTGGSSAVKGPSARILLQMFQKTQT